jgi:adapter protein MecA 1/2
MKIERVDDKTVKCFLSNEEMEEYQIDYKDFIMRSEKAKDMVREIIEQAEEEVGYKPPQFAFDLQIMLLQDKGLVLTLSEKEPFEAKDSDQIMEYLREMKNVISQAREKIGQNAGKSEDSESAKNPEDNNKAVNMEHPDYALFAFDKLRSVMEYATALPSHLRVSSELYYMDDTYYLYLKKGSAAYERYSKACIQAMEFGSLYGADEEKCMHIKEHGECIIPEKALKKLRLD